MITRPERRLLNWLTRGDQLHEPFYGDLLEECERGRSRLWVWWQLGSARALFAGYDMWTHKRDTAEGLALRLAMTAVLAFAMYVSWFLAVLLVQVGWRAL